MEAGDVLKFYLGLIGVVFLIWLAMGGPNAQKNSGNKRSFFLSPATLPGTTEAPQKEKPVTIEEIETKVKTAEGQAQTIQKQIEDIKISSPYKGKIFLEIALARNTNAAQQYLTLRVNPLHKEPIPISGWKIRSKITSKNGIIGQAAVLHGIPSRPNLVPIIVKTGDTIIVSTGKSPVGNASFRTNLCTGYFTETGSFTPYLRQECPRASSDPRLTPYNYDDPCLDYIETIPVCRRPKNIPQKLTISCKEYLNNEISYGMCVKAYEKTPGFIKNEWRIYLGSSEPLWKQKREELELLDTNNKLVDTLHYK